MPRFTSEEAKEQWLAACADTRERKLKAKKAKPVELTSGFQDDSTNGERPRHRVVNTPTNGIIGALEEIDSKIAALQLVRKNLIHAHELVTA